MAVNRLGVKTLTPKQKALLDYITSYLDSKGYPPSLREIQQHFHLRAYSTVHQHIEALQKKGFLQKNSFQHRGIAPLEKSEKTTQIPLLGRIWAGPLNEPIENPEIIDVPDYLVKGDKNEYYALEVKGDSMVDDGIWDGDRVLIKRETQPNENDIIVAISDGEATLKRYGGVTKQGVKLIPRNPKLPPYYVNPETFEVRGKFAGLIRNGNK